MKKTITFQKELKKDILEIFNKTVDEDGNIVESEDPTQKVLGQDGEPIKLSEFAGITNGSEIFIRSDLLSLIEFSKKRGGEE